MTDIFVVKILREAVGDHLREVVLWRCGKTVTHYRPRYCKATYARFARRGMKSYKKMKQGRRTDHASRMLAVLAGKRDARLSAPLRSTA